MFQVEGTTRAKPPAPEAWWRWGGVFFMFHCTDTKRLFLRFRNVNVLGALFEHLPFPLLQEAVH